MKKIATLKNPIETWQKLLKDVEDLETFEALATEEKDETALRQIETETASLYSRVAALETRTKLSGESDILNAIVSIHAGAGGTESCDWADML